MSIGATNFSGPPVPPRNTQYAPWGAPQPPSPPTLPTNQWPLAGVIPVSAPPSIQVQLPTLSQQRGMSMVLYGPTKVGKTSFASQFGRTGVIIDSQELGIYFLTQRNLIPLPVFIEEFPHSNLSWGKLLSFIPSCALKSIDTLLIESISGLQTLCFLDHAKRRFSSGQYPDGDMTNGNSGFYSYSKGPKSAAQFDWPNFMEAINVVLKSGKNVIITGHCVDKQFTNVFGEQYQKTLPACEWEIWLKLSRWASIVALMTTKEEQDREKSRNSLKKTARPDMQRFIYTEATPFFEAGNWWGMKQTVISCGNSGRECFVNFMQALGA